MPKLIKVFLKKKKFNHYSCDIKKFHFFFNFVMIIITFNIVIIRNFYFHDHIHDCPIIFLDGRSLKTNSKMTIERVKEHYSITEKLSKSKLN